MVTFYNEKFDNAKKMFLYVFTKMQIVQSFEKIWFSGTRD